MSRTIILGTRSSPMAVAVAQQARSLIERQHHGIKVEVRGFASLGDRVPGDLKVFGGKGAFVKDLEDRLLNREIDCAIHALKDIPGDIAPHPDLVLCSFFQRSDPRDALIMRAGLAAPGRDAEGLVIGTTSPRRQAQLRKMHEGMNVVALRGNVDSRLHKLDDKQLDGIVVSVAGLGYLNALDRITKIYEPEEMLPAVGQGVLCLQIRREDFARCSYLRTINSETTEIMAKAERAMLETLQGNCYSAIAGYCAPDASGLKMAGAVFSPDGKIQMKCESRQPDSGQPEQLGRGIGEQLLTLGARDLIGLA
ncbi:MAG: hydroxymethylbilane synthase [Alphaproteobacteria bacterium]